MQKRNVRRIMKGVIDKIEGIALAAMLAMGLSMGFLKFIDCSVDDVKPVLLWLLFILLTALIVLVAQKSKRCTRGNEECSRRKEYSL